MTGSDLNTAQFRALAQLSAQFQEAGLDCWLRGGWALDFLLGRITRSHDDLDVVAWRQDAEEVRARLEKMGWRFERSVGAQMDFIRGTLDLSVVFIARDEGGRITAPGIPNWIWLAGSLDEPPHTLNGVTCHILSPAQLLDEKAGYAGATGRPLRPKDHFSLALLHELLAVPAR